MSRLFTVFLVPRCAASPRSPHGRCSSPPFFVCLFFPFLATVLLGILYFRFTAVESKMRSSPPRSPLFPLRPWVPLNILLATGSYIGSSSLSTTFSLSLGTTTAFRSFPGHFSSARHQIPPLHFLPPSPAFVNAIYLALTCLTPFSGDSFPPPFLPTLSLLSPCHLLPLFPNHWAPFYDVDS